MKAIIHAGMSKTGTSSIQQTFARLNHPDIFYPEGGNHSSLTALLFMKDPMKFAGFRSRGLTSKELMELREERKRYLLKNIRKRRRKHATHFVLSSEHISSLAQGKMVKLRKFIERRFDEYEVVVYVRPPMGYMTSAFQQRLKGNLTDIELVWPKYRRRLEVMDKVFGQERVTFKLFKRDALYKGDVVADFAKFIGFEIDEDKIINRNESLSLDATALLYVQRKYAHGFVQGTDKAVRENFRYTDFLRTLTGEKLKFSNELLIPLVEEYQEDLNWMESRIGQRILDNVKQEGVLIEKEEDMIEAAWSASERLVEVLPGVRKRKPTDTLENLVLNVKFIRKKAIHGDAKG